MPTGSLRLRLGLATAVTVAVLTAGLVVAIAEPAPATARGAPAQQAGLTDLLPLTGLEELVGVIDPLVRAQLPLDPRLYAAYRTRPTPSRCSSGTFSCIDKTITDMATRFDRLAPSCDHDAVFSLLYLRVTERYKEVAATPEYFLDPRKVNYEDAVFSDLYTGAFDDWHADAPATVPPIWRLAFATADSSQAGGSGDALLGMAAHILRDLPFTLYRIGMVDHRDHLAVNSMLESVYSAAITELAQRFDPTMSTADIVPGTKSVFMGLIAQWREQGWQNAQDLTAAPDDAARAEVADRIERDAWNTGITLYLGTRYAVQQETAVRDAYCATHWNS
ncbi:MAG: DUF5995 family protein [Mycobacteriales bacterium]